jgi:hypothetical protein
MIEDILAARRRDDLRLSQAIREDGVALARALERREVFQLGDIQL